MNLSEAFRESVLALLHQSGHKDAAEVISWKEQHNQGGYCETCSFEYWTVDIVWRDAAGNEDTYEYSGTFGELLNGLLRAEVNQLREEGERS